jgi:hypothetical protein
MIGSLTSKKRAWATAKFFILEAISLSLFKAEALRLLGFVAEGNASRVCCKGENP